jgi:Mce-associated membrane protein
MTSGEPLHSGDVPAPAPARPPYWPLAPYVAVTAIAALLAVAGYMVFAHQRAADDRRHSAEFAAAARQSVLNLMSIDHATAAESAQRVLDGSTGKFKANFEETVGDFVTVLQEEKITTRATVNDAAVESMTADSAVVLVSATSRREGPDAPADQQEPRLWRIVVTMEREGDQIKMSGVEFV